MVEPKENVFDITRDLEHDESMNYEDKRSLLKLGNFKSALLLFQGTVGLSMFTLQKPMEMVGLYWGLIVTIVVGYITTVGLVLLCNLAQQIEVDEGLKRKIKNFEEITRHLKGAHVPWVKWLMMISGICMMYASTVSNILLVTKHLSSIHGFNENLLKLIIFGCIAFLFMIFIEPEKIQFLNVITTTLLLVLAYLFIDRKSVV